VGSPVEYAHFHERHVPRRERALAFQKILYAFLIFLFPLALYCLALAHLNRSRRPVLVSGVWDCIGMLFGLVGFLLWTVPTLLAIVAVRFIVFLPGSDDPEVAELWVWTLYTLYYGAVVAGALLLLALRRHKTAIYNVDTDRFGERLAVALADLGLDCIEESGRLTIAPVEAMTSVPTDAISAEFMHTALGRPTKRLHVPPGGPRYAEVRVEAFPTLCHITLHWDSYAPLLRRTIESQLARSLEHAAAPDNPAAGWLLGFSGLIFGTVTMSAILFVVLLYWRLR
jgi:hypothetical protein